MRAPDGDRETSASSVWTSSERTSLLRARAEANSLASRDETRVLLDSAGLEPGLRVLDVACGPGDPALTIAARVGNTGHVSGVDISEGAIEVARELAEKADLHNIDFRTADVAALPFDDESFDRVTCRFGCMFFEDLPRALREILRVLRRGGKAAFMVWASFDQKYFQSTVGVALGFLGRTSLPAEKAVPFRFAAPSSLEDPLAAAGYQQIFAANRSPSWEQVGSPESVCEEWISGAVYFRPILDAIPPEDLPALRQEIARSLAPYFDGRKVRVPLAVRVITARR